MKIYVDADACPVLAKETLFKVSERLSVTLVFIANQFMRLPKDPLVEFILANDGPDEADNMIVELMEAGDLVITSDIPLADRAIKKDGDVLDPRGVVMDKENIGSKLGTRNLMEELRNNGLNTGGPSAYSKKDRQDFANAIDKYLTRRLG
tara:strand:+ start:1365 stop:1814 length:450 start_codon:yes stop_codon:yes gene_type:complete